MITLADSQQYALEANPEVAAFNTPQNQAFLTDAYARGTSQFGRGLRSAGLQEDVGFLADNANDAYRRGDIALAQALEVQMQDKAAQAQQWAPTTQNFTDINSVGSAVDWATGSLGQGLRSTLLPAAGSLVGAGAGALTGVVTKNPALGAKVGAGVGGFLGGYNMEANEAIAGAMMDPQIRANKTMQEIKDAGRVKGVAAGALEAVVPAMMVGKAAGLAGRVAKGDRLAAIGRAAGQGAITEFGTEAAQDLTGQATENYLKDQALTDFDGKQAFNAAMAGAVGGGGMGVMGGAAQVATSQLGAGVDRANEIRKDPVGAVADGITDLGAKAGVAGAKIVDGLSRKFENSFNEESKHRSRLVSEQGDEASAIAHAQRIIEREDASESSRQDAASLLAGQMNWQTYRDKRFVKHEESRRSSMDEDIANEITQRTSTGKQSRMSPTLTDDFGEQEGRVTTDDSVIDDFGNKVRSGVSGIDARSQAQIANAGPQATRKAERELKNQRDQDIIGLADIWRKQGVKSDLIESSEKLKTADRASAIATLGWVSNGFKDVDGNLFVPESFTRKYKGSSVERITEAVKLAVDQGLIDKAQAESMLPQINDMAKKQWADQTNVVDTVFSAVQNKPLGRQWSKQDVEGFIPELRRMAENGTTKREEDFLEQLFGSKEGIAKAMSAFKGKKPARVAEGGPSVDGEENNGSDDLDYATKEKAKAPRLVGLMGAVEDDGTPFDTNEPSQRLQAEGILGTSQIASHPMSVGLVDYATTGLDADQKRSAENDLLDAHGEEYLKPLQKAAINAHASSVSEFLEGVHHNTRTAILGHINKRFRYVTENAQAQDAQAADKVYHAESFAENFDERSESSTIHKGALFLETAGKTAFKTSALRVLKHIWRSNAKEQVTTTQGQGAHNLYQQLMQGLAALITSDDKFTGRIGFKTRADGDIRWLDGKADQLPKEFKLSKATMDDALEAMEAARRGGETEKSIGYAETPREKYRALVAFAKNLGDSEGAIKFSKVIHRTLKSGDKAAVEKLYTQIRNKFDGTIGSIEGFKDSKVGEKNDDDVSVIDANDERDIQTASYSSIRDSDPTSEIHRDHTYRKNEKTGEYTYNGDGSQLGFADDAAFGAVEGVAKHDAKADEKVSQADRKKGDKNAKQGAADKAAQWAFDTIRKGMPSFAPSLKKMTEAQKVMLKRGLGQITSMSVQGLRDNWAELSGAEAKRILFYATNAVLHLKNRTDLIIGDSNVQRDAQSRAASKSGQSNALGRSEGTGGVSDTDKSGGASAAKLDAESTAKPVLGRYDSENDVITINGKKVEGGEYAVHEAFVRWIESSPNAWEAVSRADEAWKLIIKSGADVDMDMLDDAVDSKVPKSAEDAVIIPHNKALEAELRETYDSEDADTSSRIDILEEVAEINKEFAEKQGVLFSKNSDGTIKAVTFKTKGVVAINRSVYDKMSDKARHALALHEIGVHYGMEKILGKAEFNKKLEQLRNMRGVSRNVDAAYAAVPKDTHPMHVDEEAMAYLIENHANMPLVKQIIEAVKAWFSKTFNTTWGSDAVFANDMRKIAEAGFAKYSRQVRQISMSNISAKPKDGFVKVDFQKALDGDKFAASIVDAVSDNFGDKAILTGSIAMSPQVPIYRDGSNQVHDLDFVFAGTEAELNKLVNSAFEGAYPLRNINTPEYSTRSFWIPKNGRFVSTFVAGEKTGEFALFDKDGNFIKPEDGLAVDFFIRKDGRPPTVQHRYVGADGKAREVTLQNASITMSAKFKFGREKDLQDALLAGSGDPMFSKQNAEASKGATKEYADRQGRLLNSQTPNTKRATKEEIAQARKELEEALGDTVDAAFVPGKKLNGDSGDWRPGLTRNAIRVAISSDVVGTTRHESLHEFFDILKKHGDEHVRKLLEKVATNKLIMQQMERLLAKHPKALEQLRESPEEAVAYMYQFWRAGLLKMGPEATTFFEKVKQFFSDLKAKITGAVRDEQHAEILMTAFAKGAVKDKAKRDDVVKALNKLTVDHNNAAEKVGEFSKKYAKALQLVYTAEGMVELTKNKHMIKLAEMINQKSGAVMVKGGEGDLTWEGTFFDAKARQNAYFQNKLTNILDHMHRDDVELLREALATGEAPKIERIEKAVAEMKALNEELMDYIDKRNISRLDDDGKGGKVWKSVERRKDFGMPQIWDTDVIAKDPDSFKADLIKHHMKELERIAAQANEEIASFHKGAGQYANLGPAAKAEVDKKTDEFEKSGKIMAKVTYDKVTPEQVAEAIIVRVLMSNGKVDIEESTSELGITPLAASVNRRSLSWINPQEFDKYKQKDLLNIYSSYIAGMTKRGEFTARFGHGGEVIRDQTDLAFLQEMGGDDLVRQAKVVQPLAAKAWAKARAEAMDAGQIFDEPYPTLRLVGNDLHRTGVGEEQFSADLLKASKSLEHAVKAVQAMEGTLGMDVNPSIRDLNSWLMTYQNVRLLPFSLFTSLSDVVGLALNGGTMKDAWEAFVRGIREVKMGVVNDSKSMDDAAKRAEMWGAVDAISLNDTIGQGYGSMFMTGAARNISNKFFKKIGMESWNRAMRVSAATVAERMLVGWANGKLDTSNASEMARVERLYGKGFKPSDIKLDAEGMLDVKDPANQAAVTRFVNDAVLRPNAAMRPIWGSDAHYASFFHLKSFTYAMHKMWLEGALNEAKLGNYKPAMVLLSVYVPMGIAAGAAKEMLIPGEEPPWMQGGLDGYLGYGISKAGLLGVPQMVGGAWDTGFTDLAGPSVSQVRKALVNYDNPLKTMAGALPGGGTLQRYVDE